MAAPPSLRIAGGQGHVKTAPLKRKAIPYAAHPPPATLWRMSPCD